MGCVRGGHVVPGQLPSLTTQASRKNPFILYVALNQSKQASGELYWDDGDDLKSYEHDDFVKVSFIALNNELISEVVHEKGEFSMLLGQLYIFGVFNKPANVVSTSGEILKYKVRANNVLEIKCKINLNSSFMIKWE